MHLRDLRLPYGRILTPENMGGQIFHWAASSVTTLDSDILTVVDLSGNNKGLASSAGTRPTLGVLAGVPVWQTSATKFFSGPTLFSSGSARTIWWVGAGTAAGGGMVFCNQLATGAATVALYWTFGGASYVASDATAKNWTVAALPALDGHLHLFVLKFQPGSNVSFAVDGVSANLTSNPVASVDGTFGVSRCGFYSGLPTDGVFAEGGAFSSLLTASQDVTLLNYVRSRYALGST